MLETVARVPYFAYLSVLHLRESLGAIEELARQASYCHHHNEGVYRKLKEARPSDELKDALWQRYEQDFVTFNYCP